MKAKKSSILKKKKCYKNDKNKDLLTERILNKFKDIFGRPFLFDKDCVSYEIRLHLEGYLWSIGKANRCPLVFSAYYASIRNDTDKTKKQEIYNACYEANIYEADAAATNNIEAGIFGFNYFEGLKVLI